MRIVLGMDAEEFRRRTKAFALRAIRLVEALPKSRTADVLGRQLMRCGISVGANYRAACRAKSPQMIHNRQLVIALDIEPKPVYSGDGRIVQYSERVLFG